MDAHEHIASRAAPSVSPPASSSEGLWAEAVRTRDQLHRLLAEVGDLLEKTRRLARELERISEPARGQGVGASAAKLEQETSANA
jgi:hypothetical protein